MNRNKNVVETKEEDFLTPDQSIPGQIMFVYHLYHLKNI